MGSRGDATLNDRGLGGPVQLPGDLLEGRGEETEVSALLPGGDELDGGLPTPPEGPPVLGSDSQPVTAETKADGTYAFTRLPLGDYRVSIVDPDGGPLQGTKPTEAYNSRYKNTADVSIAKATGSVVDVNFGRVKPASIGDTTWIDVNRDGVQGADEPKLTGVRVRLTDVNGGPLTDAGRAPAVPPSPARYGAAVANEE